VERFFGCLGFELRKVAGFEQAAPWLRAPTPAKIKKLKIQTAAAVRASSSYFEQSDM